MSANLVIRDGDPHWWNSPDIWTVPGDDPNGSPGQPVAGEPAYLWARVHNTGDQAVSGAQVKFYWSNPATGVLRSNSTLVGSAFVDLDGGESEEVLCITPWVPEVVNQGHECVVAEVIHPADPLPSPLPDAFDPPSHRQIAQKNLSVLVVTSSMMLVSIEVAAPARLGRALSVSLTGGGHLDQPNLAHLGLEGYRPAEGHSVDAGLSLEPGCDGRESLDDEVDLKVRPGAARAVYLKIPPCDLDPERYALLHVTARERHEVIGGVSFALVAKGKGR